jgi:hypothetical protein
VDVLLAGHSLDHACGVNMKNVVSVVWDLVFDETTRRVQRQLSVQSWSLVHDHVRLGVWAMILFGVRFPVRQCLVAYVERRRKK